MTTKKRHQNIPASYLVLIRDGQILLIRRYQTGFQDGNYSMVAGHVDKGETFTKAIIREAEEEAGLKLTAEQIRVAHIMHRKSIDSERIDVFFVADSWKGEPCNREPNKCDDMSWFPLDNLPENTIPYIKQAIDSIRKNIFYSEHGW